MIAQYVDTGKVRFVFREFPLTSLHPLAPKASEAAVCAGQQDRYWEMSEKLFAAQEEWTTQGGDPSNLFRTYAEGLGLDSQAFNACLDSGEAARIIQGDMLTGQSLGVNATPYFFINELPVRGGLPIEPLGRVIDYVAAGGQKAEIVPSGEDWHVRGDRRTARAITVAFVDYASPDSAQHARQVLPTLVDTYIDTGQLLYVLHPWSETDDSPSAQAASAAECAGKQAKFWEMHEQLFDEQEAWTQAAELGPLFASYAQALDLDADEFEDCLDSEWVKLRVQAGSIVATLFGVPGAPLFLFNNGQGQEGSPSVEEFQTVIDSILNQ